MFWIKQINHGSSVTTMSKRAFFWDPCTLIQFICKLEFILKRKWVFWNFLQCIKLNVLLENISQDCLYKDQVIKFVQFSVKGNKIQGRTREVGVGGWSRSLCAPHPLAQRSNIWNFYIHWFLINWQIVHFHFSHFFNYTIILFTIFLKTGFLGVINNNR